MNSENGSSEKVLKREMKYPVPPDGDLVIPASINGVPVVAIGEEAFAGFSGGDGSPCVRSVTIEEGITSIGLAAFKDCTHLKKVVIPPSVTHIGKYAFGKCAFESADIPPSVTGIGDLAFQGCPELRSVTIPGRNTRIGIGAFDICPKLESVVIFGDASIGRGAFNGCTELEKVAIYGDRVDIHPEAFTGCPKLASVKLKSIHPVHDLGKAYIALKSRQTGRDILVVEAPVGSILRRQLTAWARCQPGFHSPFHVADAECFLGNLLSCNYMSAAMSEPLQDKDEDMCNDTIKYLYDLFKLDGQFSLSGHVDGCWVVLERF